MALLIGYMKKSLAVEMDLDGTQIVKALHIGK